VVAAHRVKREEEYVTEMFGRTTWVLVALDLTLCVYFLKPIPYSFLFPLTGLSWYLGLQLVCIYLNGDIIV